jgi:hypothetical protein
MSPFRGANSTLVCSRGLGVVRRRDPDSTPTLLLPRSDMAPDRCALHPLHQSRRLAMGDVHRPHARAPARLLCAVPVAVRRHDRRP